DASLEAQLMLDQWVYQPGLPSNAVEPHAESFGRVAAAVAAFNAGGPAQVVPWAGWGTFERQRFLETVGATLPVTRLADLDGAFHLSALGNDDVLFDWLKLCVRSHYEACAPSLDRFLRSQGRLRYVTPLYRGLMTQGDWGQDLARRIYAVARATYHPVAQAALDRVVTPG
ncbi:MAG: leukotriene A4 hydrolase C-terminal domain-containing protein, partial [Proteobacteria bacterium]|nr:leukotriene A4 hydrolase C-terminal domain-containing protein [Pseudomonadota bacterium]